MSESTMCTGGAPGCQKTRVKDAGQYAVCLKIKHRIHGEIITKSAGGVWFCTACRRTSPFLPDIPACCAEASIRIEAKTIRSVNGRIVEVTALRGGK
jgi:hypothetical protein